MVGAGLAGPHLHEVLNSPADRYASAALLADDLHAFQEGKPTLAGGTPLWRRVRDWIRARLKRSGAAEHGGSGPR